MKALKWIGIIFGALLGLLVISGLALYFAVRPYLASDSFRLLVESEVSKQLQVPIKLEPLRWEGLTVFTNSLKTDGPSKVAVKSLDLQQIRIEFALRPLLQQVARIHRIEMQSLTAEFQVPEPQAPEQTPSTPSAPPEPPPQWIQSIAPQKFEIGEIVVTQTNLKWPSGEKDFGQITQLKLLGTVDGSDVGLQATRGLLKIPQLPELKLENLKGRLREKQIFITNGTLQYQDQGSLAVDGEIGLQTPNTALLHFDISTLPLAPFIPGDWRARLIGKVNGKLKLTQDEKTNYTPQVAGNIELKEGKIEALPFLNKIAEITQTERWKSIPLDRAKANLFWSPEKIAIEEIDFESKALLLLQGNFYVQGEQVSGKTTVGTDPSYFKPFPFVQEQVFNQTSGNYVTTPVEISGTKNDIQEDLSQRMIMAAASGLLQKLPEGLGDKIQNVTDEIKKNAPGLMDLFK